MIKEIAKRILLLLLVLNSIPGAVLFAQGISINNTGAVADSSAVLDVNAPNKGMLIPRLTAAQRNAIAAPAPGLFIYETTTGELEYWNGSSWIQLSNTTLTAVNISGVNTGRSVAISVTNAAADPSAILDVQSATGGILIPRMTISQRNSIAAPVPGLLIFNLSSGLPDFYTSGGWKELCGTVVSTTTGAVSTSFNVGINTDTPDPSAMLDITSSSAGLAIPRLTSAQRDAIPSPAQGLMLFNTTTQSLNVYTGTGNWLNFAPPVTPAAPTAGSGIASSTQIVWNWNTVNGATGYKWNTANNYVTSTDNGINTTYTQTGLACDATDTLYVWAYNCTGNSSATLLIQGTSACSSCGNTWTRKANFAGGDTYSPVAFSIGTIGYIASGNANNGFGNTFWQWDQATNVWTQLADVGGVPRAGAVGFSIGAKGYVGTGYNANTAAPLNDFWEYDPATNVWTQMADFGGAARYWATGFSIGTMGYIGTGSTHTTDLWQWDQASNTWTQMANFPGPSRYYATSFSIGTEGYLGLGYDNNTGHKDFWQWDQPTNTWTQIATYPGIGGYGGASFSIGTKGYVGTGVPNGGGDHSNDFWEYDPATNAWTQKANYPAGTGDLYDVGMSIGTKGYIGTGVYNGNAFWEYCP